MRILYVTEKLNFGGGSRTGVNLANYVADHSPYTVALMGIGEPYEKSEKLFFLQSRAQDGMSLRYFRDFVRNINFFKPDIVHAMGFCSGMQALLKKCVSNSFKIVITLRHTSEKFRNNAISSRLLPLFGKVDAICCLTTYQKELYSKMGLSPKQYYVIPNIVKLRSFDNAVVKETRKGLLSLTQADVLVVYLGRLEQSKQLDVFIEALRICNSKGLNAGGILVGDGVKEYVDYLKEKAKPLGEKIQFIGFSSKPELYVQACDIGLFPTLSEALPNFIIESFSLGKTLVVSDIPQLDSIVEDGVDVLRVDKHDPVCYAQCLEKVLLNPDLKRSLEQNAFMKYESVYKDYAVLTEYLNLYRSLA